MIDNKSQLMKRMLLLPLVSSLSTSCGASHQHQLKPGLFQSDHSITPLARPKQTKKTNRRFKKKQARKVTRFVAKLKKLKYLPYGIIKKGGHPYRKLKQAKQDKSERLLNEYAIFGYLRHANSTNFPKIEAILAQRLAEGSLDINTTKCHGESLLAYAIKGYEESLTPSDQQASIEAIELLVRNGANPSLPGKLGYRHYDHIPILTAAFKQDQRLFEALLVGDLDVFSAVDGYGRNIFHAILNSDQLGFNVGFLEALLKHRCFNPEMLNQKKHVSGTTSLHYAASKNLTALKLLIQAGANLNVKDVEGNTPLHYAIGKTTYLSIKDITKGVKMLLEGGANSYLDNNQKERAIDWSRTKLKHFTPDERREVTKLCIQHGISDVIRPIISPVHLAARNGDLEALNQVLTEDPGAINTKDGSGNTPLFSAISLRNEPCVYDLIAAGADVNMLSNEGQTILHPLVKPGPKEVDNACFDKLCGIVSDETINAGALGANVAPIHCAAAYNNQLLDILIKRGARVNCRDAANNTPLHYAVCKYGNNLTEESKKMDILAAVELLCAGGADITLKNKDGKTPLDLAKETNNEAVCAFLTQQVLAADVKPSSSSGCRGLAENILGNTPPSILVY